MQPIENVVIDHLEIQLEIPKKHHHKDGHIGYPNTNIGDCCPGNPLKGMFKTTNVGDKYIGDAIVTNINISR